MQVSRTSAMITDHNIFLVQDAHDTPYNAIKTWRNLQA